MARVLKQSLVERVALIAILTLAFALRLGLPDVVEFRQDEANLSLLARQMAQGRLFPLHSIDSSVGVLQPPALLYYFLPPYLLSSDPLFATQYMGAMAALAVLLVYLAGAALLRRDGGAVRSGATGSQSMGSLLLAQGVARRSIGAPKRRHLRHRHDRLAGR
jgi:hypothetical protein